MKTVILNADNRVIRKHDTSPDNVVTGAGETAMGVEDLSQAPMHHVWDGFGFLADATTNAIIVDRLAAAEQAQSGVEKYRFLFELHAPVEQLMLDAARQEASELTSAEIQTASTPDALALVTIRNAYERMNVLNVIELTSIATQAFFAAAKELDVYGTDAALADLRIAAIQANEDAPT